MKKTFLIIFFLLPLILLGQQDPSFQYTLEESIPLSNGTADYRIAWTGGLNSPQYNTLDLNSDGKDDLVIFDRMARKILTFLQKDNQYEYEPHYETKFPEDVSNWVLLRDFDGDGRKDLFSGHVFGIAVYRNVSADGEIRWEHFPFYRGSSVSEVVLTKGLSGIINLQLQPDDLPSISDADGDGDLDIFTMNYGGAGVIEFHKNMSREQYGVLDSLVFELTDNWWGGVRECECGSFSFNNQDCPSSPGRIEHISGKSLLHIDGDGDGIKDMIISEGECSNLFLLRNTGSNEEPLISEAVVFPPVKSVSFSDFPTSFFEDLNFDGTKDLIVSPGVLAKESIEIDLSSSNWLYHNAGTDDVPAFQFQTESFLQGEMLDVGDNAVPAVADFDGDGDYDLFVSNNGNPSVVMLYRNTGTSHNPAFTLFDDDYLDLSTQSFTNMRIRIADVNADGRKDLAFTATKLNQNMTRLYVLRNNGADQFDFAGESPQEVDITVASPENLSFIDVNRDGRIDIVKGKSNGSVEWYRNENASTLDFSLQTQFLAIVPDTRSTNISFAEADLNRDGKLDIIASDQSGKIKILGDYRNAGDIASAVSDIVYDSLSGLHAPNLGGRVWVTTAPLYGDNFAVILAGTSLGGIRILRSTQKTSELTSISFYPNPLHRQTQLLKVSTSADSELRVFNSKGQVLRPAIVLAAKQMQTLSFETFAPGMYVLQFSTGNKVFSKRLVIY